MRSRRKHLSPSRPWERLHRSETADESITNKIEGTKKKVVFKLLAEILLECPGLVVHIPPRRGIFFQIAGGAGLLSINNIDFPDATLVSGKVVCFDLVQRCFVAAAMQPERCPQTLPIWQTTVATAAASSAENPPRRPAGSVCSTKSRFTNCQVIRFHMRNNPPWTPVCAATCQWKKQ